MPLTKLTTLTNKIINLADKPNLNANDLKAYFDSSPEELQATLNNAIDQLKSTTDTDSGADNIGATAIGTSPTTVQGILEWLANNHDIDRGIFTPYWHGKSLSAGGYQETIQLPFMPTRGRIILVGYNGSGATVYFDNNTANSVCVSSGYKNSIKTTRTEPLFDSSYNVFVKDITISTSYDHSISFTFECTKSVILDCAKVFWEVEK